MGKQNQFRFDLRQDTFERGDGTTRMNRRQVDKILQVLKASLPGETQGDTEIGPCAWVQIDLDSGRCLADRDGGRVAGVDLSKTFEIMDRKLAADKRFPNYLGITDMGRAEPAVAFKAEGRARSLDAPEAAWVLLGDSASLLGRDTVTRIALGRAAQHERIWTCTPRAEYGDLLFIYYTAPHKAIRFVARAVSDPYFDHEMGVNAQTEVDPHQWWIELGPIAEIEPIAYRQLTDVAPSLVVKGRSGKYLSPAEANRVLASAQLRFSPRPWVDDCVLQCVRDARDLPDAKRMTLSQLRRIPVAEYAFEREVEEWFVEPLLRMLRLTTRSAGVTIRRQFPIGRKRVDYAVLAGGDPACLIEVKLRVDLDRDQLWDDSKHLRQAAGYSDALGCRFMLIDAAAVYCFDTGDRFPRRVLDRREITRDELNCTREWILS